MGYKKSFGVMGIIVLCIAISAVFGITYAAFTQSLTISGTATVKKSSWSIKFANLSTVSTTGSAAQVTAPTINTNDTKISNYSVSLTKPGDTVSYTFDVTNAGDYNAVLDTITIPTPTCTKTTNGVDTDATNVCSNLTYTLTYSDGTALAKNDALNAGATKSMKLTLTYKSTATAAQLPTADVSISNLGITLTYKQS